MNLFHLYTNLLINLYLGQIQKINVAHLHQICRVHIYLTTAKIIYNLFFSAHCRWICKVFCHSHTLGQRCSKGKRQQLPNLFNAGHSILCHVASSTVHSISNVYIFEAKVIKHNNSYKWVSKLEHKPLLLSPAKSLYVYVDVNTKQ